MPGEEVRRVQVGWSWWLWHGSYPSSSKLSFKASGNLPAIIQRHSVTPCPYPCSCVKGSILYTNLLSVPWKISVTNGCLRSVYWVQFKQVVSCYSKSDDAFIKSCLILKWYQQQTNISSKNLWKVTVQEDINVEISKRKFRWIGHTLRKEDGEIPKAALLWKPQGNRKRGRPRNRWRRSVIKEAGRRWNELRFLAAYR